MMGGFCAIYNFHVSAPPYSLLLVYVGLIQLLFHVIENKWMLKFEMWSFPIVLLVIPRFPTWFQYVWIMKCPIALISILYGSMALECNCNDFLPFYFI